MNILSKCYVSNEHWENTDYMFLAITTKEAQRILQLQEKVQQFLKECDSLSSSGEVNVKWPCAGDFVVGWDSVCSNFEDDGEFESGPILFSSVLDTIDFREQYIARTDCHQLQMYGDGRIYAFAQSQDSGNYVESYNLVDVIRQIAGENK